MACERPKPFHVHETHSHFGNPFLQKSFRLLGKRLWHVICAHNRYGEWMIGEASGIVGRFESRLRQQRNHTIFPAFGSPLVISTTSFLPGREAIKSGAAPRSRGCLTAKRVVHIYGMCGRIGVCKSKGCGRPAISPRPFTASFRSKLPR